MANLLCVSHEWHLGFEALRALVNSGFYIIPATNGYEALWKYGRSDVDALVVNRHLPDIDVLEFIHYLKHHNPDIPVVMISNENPLPKAPPEVDAVIGKHAAAELLAPTLEVLLMKPTAHRLTEEGNILPQAA
ncbi:MAG: response regulator [Terriglobales bacterium]